LASIRISAVNGIIFIGVAASVMGHGAYWHGGIATLENGAGDAPLASSPYATIPGMNEFSILAGGQGGLVFRLFPWAVVPRGFFHFVSLGQLFHVQAR